RCHESIIGWRSGARVLADTAEGVVPIIAGTANRVARTDCEVDPHDPLVPGNVLRGLGSGARHAIPRLLHMSLGDERRLLGQYIERHVEAGDDLFASAQAG